ncbi:biopolymer transport protein [Mizugakiibacter sediminis]|uniref:Biopolymer transport protein n=1 Tax=Mizugakiibacter sediminis TaxID=1475481 RepID=A0A0K8QQW4_9GAMM|nr:biopolymer transporter ExbD [Mizugakiibacter sediminis]GAP67303.1 biopolymer transport protein [Mizugakiibacter sediminis]
MRIGQARREDDFEINVISLIDVLLTLLMFFVMTTTFVQHARMKVTLPEASAQPAQDQRDALILMVDREGHYSVGSDEVLGTDVDSLKQAIARVAGDDHDRPVLLRADAMTPHQSVVTAMDALAQLGFTRLSIATTPSAEPRGK